MKIALIVEGHGDDKAFPNLVVKTGQMIGEHYVVGRPIAGGTAEKLERDGVLEKTLILASSRPDIDLIIVAVDLDDGCPSDYQKKFTERSDAIAGTIGVPVRYCFCIREYEAWFLYDLDTLREKAPEFGWVEGFVCADPTAKRDAKGLLNEAMEKHYKPTQHQLRLTQLLDLKQLYSVSRSYRKLVKSLTGVDYDTLNGFVS